MFCCYEALLLLRHFPKIRLSVAFFIMGTGLFRIRLIVQGSVINLEQLNEENWREEKKLSYYLFVDCLPFTERKN